jgi:uncharacterized YccA/Bax inhibitor family protein
MALFKTSNPALSDKTFQGPSGAGFGGAIDTTARMTLQGTVNKTGFLMLLAIAGAAFTWHLYMQDLDASAAAPFMLIGVFGGFILAMVTIFKQTWAPFTSPIYALLEGLFLGGMSALLETKYPGIAIQAVGLTFGVLLVMLMVYSSGLIKVTQRFYIGVAAATGGIAVFYLVQMVLGMFGVHFLSINNSSPLSIGISLFVVVIAALNLVLDFDFIERGVNAGAPKYMEWYGAFGLMVTMVWLYLEILRLLSKIRSRN